MLPKTYRYALRQNADFFQNAKRVSGPFFTVFFQKGSPLTSEVNSDTSDSPAQAAVIVPIKVSNKATTRNRLKRQVRRALFSTLPQLKNLIVVIVVHRQFAPTELEILQKRIQGTA